MNTYLAIKKVKPLEDYQLMLTFSNGEKRIFDMKPYLNKGIFKELRKVSMFNTAHIILDTVAWDNEADFDPEFLYSGSKKIKPTKYSIPAHRLTTAAEPRAKYEKQAHRSRKVSRKTIMKKLK